LAQFRQLYNSCDRRIAPSALLAEQLGNEGFLPFDCVPNGISKVSVLGSESAKGASVRKRYRLKEKVVLHFGRLSREKNIDQVIRAFALLGTHLSETSLLLIGGGPDVERLRSLIRTLRIEDSVVFAGEISHQELLESGVLSVADLFVTASPMESQGMVIIEAMSFGLPIVAVGEGAVPEVVGENGLLLAKGDVAAMAARVIEVLTRPDLAKKLRRLSLERAEFFSLPRVTDRLLEIYREAISAKERSKKAPPSL
jgi:glycosyltransferase involved in cell wall biosynthesis